MIGRAALTVYVREYCHLCHEMVAAIEALQPVYAFDLEVIDVDDDMTLESRYGNLVPVLTANDRKYAATTSILPRLMLILAKSARIRLS